MLLNTLATAEQLSQSPSRQDGIPEELETQVRIYGCQLIQHAGMLLKLPQRTMATAQVLFQRFWFVSSLKQFSSKDICMGSLFLSTKLEESPARLRDLINVFDYLIQRDLHCSSAKLNLGSPQDQPGPTGSEHGNGSVRTHLEFRYRPQSYFAQEFYDMKDALVVAEMQLLKRLGFHVQVNLPYATMVNYLQLLGLAEVEVEFSSPYNWTSAAGPEGRNADAGLNGDADAAACAARTITVGFAQRAWAFLNDALQTPVYCLFGPHVLACAVIYLTAQTARPQVALPLLPQPWWRLFDVDLDEIRIVNSHLLRLYHPTGPSAAIRREMGGLCEMLTKKDIREWLATNEIRGS